MAQSSSAPVGRALAKIALAATAWGTGGVIAAELFATGMGPFAVTFWRFAGGTTLLALTALASRARPAPVGWRTVLIGAGLAAYQAAYFLGCAWAGVAVATVVTLGAGPVLVAVGAWLTGSERLGPAGLVTVLVAVLGLAALVGAGGQAPHPFAGVGAALLSASGYAAITLHARSRAGRPGGGVELVTFAAGTVALLPIALVDGVLPGGDRPVRSWLLLGYLAAVPTVAAYRLYFAALAHVRAGTAAVAVLLEAVVAALLALWVLGERLGPLGWSGMALLLGAVTVRTAMERRAYRPVPAGLGERPAPDYPGVST